MSDVMAVRQVSDEEDAENSTFGGGCAPHKHRHSSIFEHYAGYDHLARVFIETTIPYDDADNWWKGGIVTPEALRRRSSAMLPSKAAAAKASAAVLISQQTAVMQKVQSLRNPQPESLPGYCVVFRNVGENLPCLYLILRRN